MEDLVRLDRILNLHWEPLEPKSNKQHWRLSLTNCQVAIFPPVSSETAGRTFPFSFDNGTLPYPILSDVWFLSIGGDTVMTSTQRPLTPFPLFIPLCPHHFSVKNFSRRKAAWKLEEENERLSIEHIEISPLIGYLSSISLMPIPIGRDTDIREFAFCPSKRFFNVRR